MSVRHASGKRAFAGDLAAALLAPTIALLAAELLHKFSDLTRVGVLFLAAVAVVASVRGRRAALLTAPVSLIAYTLFLQARIDEQMTAVENMINLAVFTVVALLTGALAGKVHDEAARARRHARNMELLFKTSRTLSEEDEQRFWPSITDAVAHSSRGSALALDANGTMRAQSGEAELNPAAHAFGRKVLESEAEWDSSREEWRARLIRLEGALQGVLVWNAQEDRDGSEEFVQLVVDLASASIARSRVRQEQSKIEAARETGKLREALLSSISHDFRSPLAAIIGSSTSLLEYGDKFDDAVRRDLLLNIQDEGERLNQFVGSLLDMTRLQSGVVQPSKEPVTVVDVIAAAAERLKRHRGQLLRMDVLAADCAVLADPLLLEQVFYNILDNTAKYAASPGGVQITCTEGVDRAIILIADHGPGLPREDQPAVFEPFHFARSNAQTSGTGLGLSITRGFVEAMGGSVEAHDRSDGQPGLEIAITLPRVRT